MTVSKMLLLFKVFMAELHYKKLAKLHHELDTLSFELENHIRLDVDVDLKMVRHQREELKCQILDVIDKLIKQRNLISSLRREIWLHRYATAMNQSGLFREAPGDQ